MVIKKIKSMHLSPDMQWHEGKFNPQEWMVDNIINVLKSDDEAK